jgi:hypothetical protein
MVSGTTRSNERVYLIGGAYRVESAPASSTEKPRADRRPPNSMQQTVRLHNPQHTNLGTRKARTARKSQPRRTYSRWGG